MYRNTKAQLKEPYRKRDLAFSEHGYSELIKFKQKMETQLQRELSESVAIDILLTRNPDKYVGKYS
jgi:hypothetical protein